MKQNNTLILFKCLALCFLILGNLTVEVLCGKPAPAAVVELKSGEVSVPKIDICDAINSHYKVKSSKDFFKKLVSADEKVTEYKFLFNSADSGRDILTDTITNANAKLSAEEIFNSFKTDVNNTKTDADNLKTLVSVNAAELEGFMSNFEFKNGKFVYGNTGSYVSLDDIADNLVVYLNCTLDGVKKEVTKVKGVTDAQQAALIAAEVKLAVANADAAKTAADATVKKAAADAKNELDKAKDGAKDKAIYKAKDAVKNAVLTKLATAPASTSTPTSFKVLLDALNSYHIKTEYNYTPATASTLATATVMYSIVDTPTTASDPNISSTPIAITDQDIEIAKIFFLPHFIDTKIFLANRVFPAISEKCSRTSTDANAHFKAILSELSPTNFGKTIEDALSKCGLEKTVSENEFNEAFKSRHMIVSVGVKESDIDDRKIQLHWLSNVTDPSQQFKSYIAWLESATKLASTPVADKKEAIEAFFTLLKDQNNLDEYKTKLEKDLKDPKSQTPGGGNGTGNSNVPKQSESGMKPITIIFIVLGSAGGLVIIVVVFFTWKSYSKKNKV